MKSNRTAWRIAGISLMAALLGSHAIAQSDGLEPLPNDLGKRLTESYIRPATADFANQSGKLQQSIAALCASQTVETAAAQTVQQQFAQTITAWSKVEILRFGPLVEANRYERIMFWPDPRGTTARQIQSLLASPDITSLTAAQLASQSVATNGLPAIEFVLYRDGGLLSDDAKPEQRQNQCHFAVIASTALQASASELASAWAENGQYAALFSQPSPVNPTYRSQTEVAAEAIKALTTGLQFAGETKLAPVLKEPQWQENHVRRAPFWRSSLSLQAIQSSVEGMAKLYQAMNIQYESEEAWRNTQLQQTFEQLQMRLASMPASLQQQMQPPDTGKQALEQVRDLLHKAREQVSGTIAPYVGVSIGFNALDGD